MTKYPKNYILIPIKSIPTGQESTVFSVLLILGRVSSEETSFSPLIVRRAHKNKFQFFSYLFASSFFLFSLSYFRDLRRYLMLRGFPPMGGGGGGGGGRVDNFSEGYYPEP